MSRLRVVPIPPGRAEGVSCSPCCGQGIGSDAAYVLERWQKWEPSTPGSWSIESWAPLVPVCAECARELVADGAEQPAD